MYFRFLHLFTRVVHKLIIYAHRLLDFLKPNTGYFPPPIHCLGNSQGRKLHSSYHI